MWNAPPALKANINITLIFVCVRLREMEISRRLLSIKSVWFSRSINEFCEWERWKGFAESFAETDEENSFVFRLNAIKTWAGVFVEDTGPEERDTYGQRGNVILTSAKIEDDEEILNLWMLWLQLCMHIIVREVVLINLNQRRKEMCGRPFRPVHRLRTLSILIV